jgi:hypothetical protein
VVAYRCVGMRGEMWSVGELRFLIRFSVALDCSRLKMDPVIATRTQWDRPLRRKEEFQRWIGCVVASFLKGVYPSSGEWLWILAACGACSGRYGVGYIWEYVGRVRCSSAWNRPCRYVVNGT